MKNMGRITGEILEFCQSRNVATLFCEASIWCLYVRELGQFQKRCSTLKG